MKIKINYRKKTGTLKEIFNNHFPYLKIEFFNVSHKSGEATSANNIVSDNVYLEKLNPIIKEGTIMISPNDAVSNVENAFQKFGLFLQVFRKQNNVWIETTRTDNLSLSEQNEMGKTASKHDHPAVVADRYLEDGQY